MLQQFRGLTPPLAGVAAMAAAALAISVAPAGAQTLVTWDDYTLPTQSPVIEQLNKDFMAANPGVTINRTARTFDDLSMTLKLAVSNGDGPEVTKVNQGAADMGTMVKQNLLVPLDPYVQKYGWDKRQSAAILARTQWDDKGQFGQGKVYGISSLGEMVGLYYNQKVLDQAGLKPPTSFEDFLTELDTLKSKGITPFMIGTAHQHMALHLWAGVAQAHIGAADRGSLDTLVYGRGGDWDAPFNLEAAKLVQHWAQDGYFFDGYQGISGDDAVQLFTNNQGAFLVSGTWYLGNMQSNPDIHFIPIPAPKDVKAPLTVGGVDLAWAITSVAKTPADQDLGGKYIDYMTSDKAATAWASAGFLPATNLPDNADIKVSPILKEALAMWKTVNSNNALGHYPDWASPTMLKTFDENLPLVMAGSEKPEDFIGKLDADYKAYMSGKS